MNKAVGVYAGIPLSFMDHLVPLCQLMGIPLFCTSPWIHALIQLYYPPMPLICQEAPDFILDPFLKDYEVLFYADHYRRPQGSFQFVDYLYKGPARSVCTLHGQSDKKRNLYWIERFVDEDVSLFYGEHMLDFLEEKGVLKRLKSYVVTGNTRYAYYLKHHSFFDAQAQRYFPRDTGKKTLLYAPTWTHRNKKWAWKVDYTDFFAVYPFVFDSIPEDFQLLVKLHPFFETLYPEETAAIKEKYGGEENISFINDFPLIYPLLAKVDGYLGDYSSIGYDFLAFDRPLFFLNHSERDPTHDKGVFLHRCGTRVAPSDLPSLYSLIRRGFEEDAFSEIRKKTYAYAFGAPKPLERVKQEIERACR